MVRSGRGWVSVLLLISACSSPSPEPGAPDSGIEPPPPMVDAAPPPSEDQEVVVSLTNLEPGWVVSTSRLTEVAPAAEASQVSDGSDLTLVGTQDDVFITTVTDADGAVVATQAMNAQCNRGAGRRLRVPQDYTTIQAAVDAAEPGDIVKVGPGTYTESIVLGPGICLLGTGAKKTTLDAGGQPINLVDLSNAPGSTVAGFTFTGVAQGVGCAQPSDPFACSGDWYRAGLYLGGSFWNNPTESAPPLVMHNVFKGNDIGVMLYYRGVAVIRSNVFVDNRIGFTTNHYGSSRTIVANNVFYNNAELAVGNHAAYLDIINNIIVGSDMAIRFAAIQYGVVACNLFYGNTTLANEDRFSIGSDGNIDDAPGFVNPATGDFKLTPGSLARNKGCHKNTAFEVDGSEYDIGAHGGPLGIWDPAIGPD